MRKNPPRWRYLATSDEGDACHCCGRTNLKRYVWLVELDEDGNEISDPAPYGTTCAGHLLRGSCGKKPTVSQSNDLIEHARARSKAQFHDEFSKALQATERLVPPEPVLERGRIGQYVVRVGDVSETYAGSFETDAEAAESWRRWKHDKIRAANRHWHERRALEWMEQNGQRTDLAPRSIGSRIANPDDDDFDDEDLSDAPASYRAFSEWIRALKRRKIEFIEEHRKIFERDGIVVVPGFDGRYTLALTRGTTSPYRVTQFLADEPVGHGERDTLDDALVLLWEDATSEYKRAPPQPKPNPRARELGRRLAAL